VTTPADEDIRENPGSEHTILDLMRIAIRGYARAIEEHLGRDGIGSLPRNSGYVIERLSARETPMEELVRGLGISKQAVSKLIDVMAERDFLTRAVDPADRRRTVLRLTARGEAAAAAILAGTREVEERLRRHLPPGELAGLKAGLTALAEVAADDRAEAAS
jgi:DNA-binding MarR family transcriptional regulator